MRWRLCGLSGAAVGLGLSPLAGAWSPIDFALASLAACGVLAARPRRRAGPEPTSRNGAETVWLLLVCLLAASLGLLLGAARLGAIDKGALRAAPGSSLRLSGFVAAVPRRSDGIVRTQVEAPEGRVLVEAREPVGDLEVGEGISAAGVLAPPPGYYSATLRRQGIAMVLRAGRIEATGAMRGGLAGRLDTIRRRAEEALGDGAPRREAALARGFVLGQDDRIDPATVNDFRRSGLSHLLAVSGQNVVLLALLATPLLALLGLSLRQRLLWTCALIAVYVPLAGGGPSIQRAGVMGAAGIVATLAGRPGSRAYALLAAAVATLALNPRATGDVGWQLSFAAVAGIFLLAGPLRGALVGSGTAGWRRSLADGVAITIAATVATAPLIAHHFGTFSLTSLPANLLVLPAVAPSMWLGMIVAAAAQVPGLPVEPLNAVNAVLLAYVAQVAAWFGRPRWAVLDLPASGPGAVLAAYAALAGVTFALLRAAAVRRRARAARAERAPRRPRSRPALAAGCLLAAAAALLLGGGPGRGPDSPFGFGGGLRVEVLDVGQGDAILLQPRGDEPILVDGGPPGGGLLESLRSAGVRRLGAVLLTHDQSDHAGGVRELLGDLPVRRLAYGVAGDAILQQATAEGASPIRVAEGSVVRSGPLRVEVLWPPRLDLGAPGGEDPNQSSLVLLARWHGFAMLLTADAEAEAVPIDPGPVDVLKVAHHGSEDGGLAGLLERTSPRVAVISVGEENPYGHPVAATLATLREHRVRVYRTDRDGTVVVAAAGDRFSVRPEG